MATGKQIQRIYALGAKCGLLDRERGNDDDLHLWIKQWSRKDHISELTEKQADFIIARLIDYQNNVCPPKPSELEAITGAQQSFCFRLAYKLAQVSPSEIDVRERLFRRQRQRGKRVRRPKCRGGHGRGHVNGKGGGQIHKETEQSYRRL